MNLHWKEPKFVRIRMDSIKKMLFFIHKLYSVNFSKICNKSADFCLYCVKIP